MKLRKKLIAACFVTSFALALAAALTASANASPTCGTSGGTTVCVSVPSNTLTGYQPITASANPAGGIVQFVWVPNGGTCTPGVAGTCQIIEQFGENPGTTTDYSFEWPTQKLLDGTGTLQALVNGSVATSISGISLSNGNTSTILAQNMAPNDWQSFLPPTSWSGSTDPTFAASGDGAAGQDTDNGVGASVASTSPPLFLYLGDVYERGTGAEMLNHYGWNAMNGPCTLSDCASLAPWGSMGAVTQPTIGNHEVEATPSTDGRAWQDYWHQRPLYTSFTFANALFIDLNCGPSGAQCATGPGTAQYTYVSSLLSAPHPPCVISYWHIPALSHNRSIAAGVTALWALLADNGGTVVLNGHVHHMEEYLNLNDKLQSASNGQPAMTQLIVGSGGHGTSKVQVADSRITWSQGSTPGAAYFTLNGAANGGTPTSITYRFEDVNHNLLHQHTLACGGSPQITGFSPTSGDQGTQVAVTGSHLTGATAVTFNGTSDPTFNVDSDSQITAHVPAGASTGPICATISGSPVCSLTDFIVPQPPQVTGFAPTSGPPGTPVTVTGTHFSGATSVTFNGVPATFTPGSDTQLTASAPSGAGTGPICVTVPPNIGCSSTNFTVTLPTGINRNGVIGTATNPPGGTTQLSVTVGAGGVAAGDRAVVAIAAQGTITITSVTDSKGNSYAPSIAYPYSGTGKCTTALYSSPITTALVSGDTITVRVSSGSAWGFIAEDWAGLIASDQTGRADSGGVTMTNASIPTTGSTASPREAVFGVACISGSTTVTGDPNYVLDPPLKNVNSPTTRILALESRIVNATGGQTATYTFSNAKQWSGVIGSFAGGSASTPVVSGFTPTSGGVGTSVTVTGSKFTGASAVTFGGTSASFTPGSDTQLTATVPAGATAGPICVMVGSDTGCSATNFTVTQPPQVTGFNPASGSPGASVTVSGSHFSGASAVTFGGASASFVPGSDTQLTATVPSTALTGPICVTVTPDTACSAGNFTVTALSGIARIGQIGNPAMNQSGVTVNQLSVTVGTGGVPAGDTVIVAIAAQNAISVTGVSDSKGNSYGSNVANPYNGTGKCTTALFSSHLATGLASGDSITVNVSQGNAWGVVAEDWSGLTAFDASGTANSGGSMSTTASVTTGGSTSTPSEAVFGLACAAGNTTVTGGAGYPNVTSVKIKSGTTTRVLSLESKIVSVTGPQAATFSLSPAQTWSGVIGTYR